jgi:hypothetical protein
MVISGGWLFLMSEGPLSSAAKVHVAAQSPLLLAKRELVGAASYAPGTPVPPPA